MANEKDCDGYWSIEQAIEYAGKYKVHISHPTMVNWCNKHGIGHQLGGKGGRWLIDPKKLKRLIHGKENKPSTAN